MIVLSFLLRLSFDEIFILSKLISLYIQLIIIAMTDIIMRITSPIMQNNISNSLFLSF